MNELLQYQELDGKLMVLERKLRESEERKRAKNAKAFLAQVEERAAKLDKRAQDLSGKFNDITTVYQAKLKEVKDYVGIAEGLEEHKEIDYIAKKVEKTSNDIKKIESEAADLERDIRATHAEFEELKSKQKLAVEEFDKNSKLYLEMKAESEPAIEAMKKELKTCEPKIDKELLLMYQKKREQKIYPVIVTAVKGRNKDELLCAGCNMPIPLASRNRLTVDMHITCDECQRVIYLEKR